MKVSFKLIIIFCSLICNSVFNQTNEQIRVMTYNIRYAGDDKTDGLNSWDNRKNLINGLIRYHNPDILGVQEALISQLDDLENFFPDYIRIGVGRDDGSDRGEHSAILFKKSKYVLLTSNTFWLSETPEIPSLGWDAAFKRIVTWVKLQERNSKKIFFVFNTHFDHLGNKARELSANLLKEKIFQIAEKSPVILTGDFNCLKGSIPYELLVANKFLRDTRYDSGSSIYGLETSFNGFSNELQKGNIIDHIFINKYFCTYQNAILSDNYYGRFPSDHMPVIADINFNIETETN